jgi:hypothetical protein
MGLFRRGRSAHRGEPGQGQPISQTSRSPARAVRPCAQLSGGRDRCSGTDGDCELGSTCTPESDGYKPVGKWESTQPTGFLWVTANNSREYTALLFKTVGGAPVITQVLGLGRIVVNTDPVKIVNDFTRPPFANWGNTAPANWDTSDFRWIVYAIVRVDVGVNQRWWAQDSFTTCTNWPTPRTGGGRGNCHPRLLSLWHRYRERWRKFAKAQTRLLPERL